MGLGKPKCLAVLHGHTDEVHGVSLTPNGCRAISASEDKTLRLWDLVQGQCLTVLRGHTAPVRSVSLSADGARAVSSSVDGTLRVWDLKSDECPFLFQGHSAQSGGLLFRLMENALFRSPCPITIISQKISVCECGILKTGSVMLFSRDTEIRFHV